MVRIPSKRSHKDKNPILNQKNNKGQHAEKGPTKKQLRKEIENDKILNKIKNDKKKGKIDSEEASKRKRKLIKDDSAAKNDKKRGKIGSEEDNKRKRKSIKGNNAGKSDKKKSDKKNDNRSTKNIKSAKINEKLNKRKLIKNTEKKNNLIYNEENINTFLIDGRTGPKDKTIGMILYLFKTYKNNMSELLSKIKVLNYDKDVDVEGLSLQGCILKHIFVFFGMKKDFYNNLFDFISEDSILSKVVCSYYFSQTFEGDDFQQVFDKIEEKLLITLKGSSSLNFGEYIDLVNDIDSFSGDVLEYSIKESKTDLSDPVEVVKHQENEDSDFSLTSLNDDNEISRLDTNLSKYFLNGHLSARDEKFVISLTRYLEIFVKNSQSLKIDDLIRILYFYDMPLLSSSFKFIIKCFLRKSSDKMRMFRIFQICSMVLPKIYGLYNIFHSSCNEEFDNDSFIKNVFKRGHEEYVLSRINKDSFYEFYLKNQTSQYSDFLINLISEDNRPEALETLVSKVVDTGLKNNINTVLARVNKKNVLKNTKPSNKAE